MTPLAGTAVLTRFALRRERFTLPWWVLGGVFVYWSQAVGVALAYPTQAELDAVAGSMASNAAMIAMAGPPRVLDTVGGQVAFQAGVFGMLVAGLMGMVLIGRHTRSDEETGRAELIRSGAVGRYAPVAAATIVTAAACAGYGAAVAASLIAYGLPAAGSVALGLGATCAGLVFAAVALLAAQLAGTTRTVYGVTGAALATAYVLRAVGDVAGGPLSWLSPLGWGQAMRPYAGELWWPASVSVAAALVLGALATAVLDRRDIGAGLFAPRPGRARGGATASGATGLAWRLQRGALLGWSVGMFGAGLAFGTIGDDVADLFGDVDLGEILGRDAASATDAFYAMAAALLAMIGSAFTISAGLRLRAEESAGHAEPLLATGLTRWRWVASHAAIMLVGSALVVAMGGLGTGLMYGAITDDPGQVPLLFGAALVYLPAVWVLGGVTLLLFGAAPRASAAAWLALAFCVVVLLFGATLRFPDRLSGISPFHRLPPVPAVPVDWPPVLVTTLLALALCLLGAAAFRRRDAGAA